MSSHLDFTAVTGLPVYILRPAQPLAARHQRKQQGPTAAYFPQSVDLAGITQTHLDDIAAELNARPRKTLKWATPAARFAHPGALTGWDRLITKRDIRRSQTSNCG